MTDADDVILSVAGLRVRDSWDREILHGLDLDVRRGECLALVGESGAGKSLTLRALAGLLPHGFTVSGTMDFEGRTLCAPGAFAAVRGRRILYMAQQAMTAFDPLVRIGVQLGETASAAGLSGSKADEAVSRALRAVGLDPARILRAFPCELSGGMLQRVMTACVLILRPDVILADEPTSALDVVNVRAVLASLQEVRRTTGSALVLVTHDLGLAAGLADRFVILMSGGIVEKGGREIFERPSHPYTQRLALAWRRANAVLQESLAAGPAPAAEEPQRAPEAEPVLRIEGVTKYYASGSFLRRSVHEVLRGVNLEVRRGEVVGLIGGSAALAWKQAHAEGRFPGGSLSITAVDTNPATLSLALERGIDLRDEEAVVLHGIDEEEMLFHTLHGRAALGAEERVEVVVAALNGTLEDGADIRADTAGHVVGRNVGRLAARRAQAAREAARQVEQNLGDVITVVPEGDFPVVDRLRDEFVLRILQEIFEENQMFQVFHIVPSFKIIPIAAM